MGEVTGLPEVVARQADATAGAGAPARLARGVRAVPRGRAAPPGRALHGLRHPVLQQRLPARQPHPRLERPRLPRPAGARRSSGCTRRTTSPSSPAACALRRARPRACSASTSDPVTIKQVEVEIVDRAWAEGWVEPQPPAVAHRQERRGRRIRARGPRRRAAAHARGTASSCSSAPIASAGSCATASPSSRWRSATSSAGSSRCAARAPSSGPASSVGVDVTIDRARRGVRRDRARRAARPRGATCRSPVASSAASTRRWSSCRFRNRVQEGDIDEPPITAHGKHVVIIGGGDTGADCLGTVHRQGAASVPPVRDPAALHPTRVLRTTLAAVVDGLPHLLRPRGRRRARVQREHRVLPRRRRRATCALLAHEVEMRRRQVREDRGHRLRAAVRARAARDGLPSAPSGGPMLDQLGVELDARGNVDRDAGFQTSVEGVPCVR